MSAASPSTNRAGASLLLRGYGPLVAFMVFFALMAMMVPTVGVDGQPASGPADGTQAQPSQPEAAEGAAGTAGDEPAPEADERDGAGPEVGEADPADGTQDAADPTGDRATGEAGDGEGDSDGGGTTQAAAEGVQPCDDRELQVPGDPYSPPCITFTGENPGATHRGVTEDEILITARTPDEPGFQDELANLAEADIADTPDDVRRTFDGLVDYFNERFEFYGRELRIEFYEGQGSPTTELLGGGREEAQADALTVAEKFGAFAEMNAGSEPFGDALSTQGVVNFGVPFLSRHWMTERRPYAWSMDTDCSIVAESGSIYAGTRLIDRDAEYARGELQGNPRRIANIVPENPWYQECLDDSLAQLERQGQEVDLNLSYELNLGTLSNQAASLVARLQSEQITTVICSCDPVLPVFLTARATEQGYTPEWVITGVGFTDEDYVGQLFDQDQWSRAFGISYRGQVEPLQASLGYNAYRQVRDDEPAFAVNGIYNSLYLLAIGIQGAGPELTPATFEQGMFDYPPRSGPQGTWGFGEQNYTPTEDFREVYWDPDEISPFNNERGAYIEAEPGVRHRPGELTEGGPKVPW